MRALLPSITAARGEVPLTCSPCPLSEPLAESSGSCAVSVSKSLVAAIHFPLPLPTCDYNIQRNLLYGSNQVTFI